MINYYTTLGLPSSASPTEIKKAFRRLAVQYHPDKNQGSDWAEHRFKQINHAYQVLSDPYKKRQYDHKLFATIATDQKTKTATPPPTPKSTTSQASPKQKKSSPRTKSSRRSISKELSLKQWLGVFALTALTIYGFVGASIYQINQEKREKEKFGAHVTVIQLLYRAHLDLEDFDKAYEVIASDAIFYNSIYYTKAKTEINEFIVNLADDAYRNGNYTKCLEYCFYLEKINQAKLIDKLRFLSHLKLRNIDDVLELEPTIDRFGKDYELSYELAQFYKSENRIKEALRQYKEAADILTSSYQSRFGAYFLFNIKSVDLPRLHFDVFYEGALLNFTEGNLEQAITSLNIACPLSKKNGKAFYLRAQCYNIKNNKNFTCNDVTKARQLGFTDSLSLHLLNCN